MCSWHDVGVEGFQAAVLPADGDGLRPCQQARRVSVEVALVEVEGVHHGVADLSQDAPTRDGQSGSFVRVFGQDRCRQLLAGRQLTQRLQLNHHRFVGDSADVEALHDGVERLHRAVVARFGLDLHRGRQQVHHAVDAHLGEFGTDSVGDLGGQRIEHPDSGFVVGEAGVLQLLQVDQQLPRDAVRDPVRLGVVEFPADARVLAGERDAAVGAAIDVRTEQAPAVVVAQRIGKQHRGILRGEVQRYRLLARFGLAGLELVVNRQPPEQRDLVVGDLARLVGARTVRDRDRRGRQ